MILKVSPLATLRAISGAILFLLIANILAVIFKLNTDNTLLIGVTTIFDFNHEANIPSLFSTLTLLVCSILLFFIFAISKKRDTSKFKWLGLSLIFLFLTIDEIGSIHEKVMVLLKGSFDLSGVFYYAWIIPYSILTVALGFIYLPFVLQLPKKIKELFLFSAAIYITGAVGIEILGGLQHEAYGTLNYMYSYLYTVEEFFEMIGIAIFIYALLLYITDFTRFDKIQIKLDSSEN